MLISRLPGLEIKTLYYCAPCRTVVKYTIAEPLVEDAGLSCAQNVGTNLRVGRVNTLSHL